MKLGWRVKASKIAYSGRFPVFEDVLVADLDGRETLYTYLGITGRAVSVLAHDGQGKILVVREYRHPIGDVVTDLPMGSVERGETPVAAAARELREETGYAADKLVHMGAVRPLPALTSLAIDYYLATDLRRVEANPDPSEILDTAWMSFDEVLERVMGGDFQHGALPHAAILAAYAGFIEVSANSENAK